MRYPLESSTKKGQNNENYVNETDRIQNEYLMPIQEFLQIFTHFELIHLDMETSRDEATLCQKKSWQMKTIHGFWQKGVTAGGCRNNIGIALK